MDNVKLFFSIFNFNGHILILDKLMVFGATALIYLTFLFILILGFKGGIKEKKTLLLIILGIPVAFLLIEGIHFFYYESRPFVTFHFTPIVNEAATSASFPSKHATIAAVVGFAYTYFKSKWAPLFLILMFWIGFSRIYVGVHYPLDVLGGFLTSIVALIIAVQIKNLLKFHFLK